LKQSGANWHFLAPIGTIWHLLAPAHPLEWRNSAIPDMNGAKEIILNG
jgi:hypothetical protein